MLLVAACLYTQPVAAAGALSVCGLCDRLQSVSGDLLSVVCCSQGLSGALSV